MSVNNESKIPQHTTHNPETGLPWEESGTPILPDEVPPAPPQDDGPPLPHPDPGDSSGRTRSRRSGFIGFLDAVFAGLAAGSIHAQAGRAEAKAKEAATPSTEAYLRHERAKRHVVQEVSLPVASAAYRHTGLLRDTVEGACELFRVWAEIPPTVLGELCHAEPGLHAWIMNAQEYLDNVRMAVERATFQIENWHHAFNRIIEVGKREGAWHYVAVASGALASGPHTERWSSAMSFFAEAWGSYEDTWGDDSETRELGGEG